MLVRPGTAEELPTVERPQLAQLGINPWHAVGCKGQGVKVAILDTGFRGYRGFLGKQLPQRLQARSFRRDGNLEAKDSQHGILCGEVVHALAPEAELLFANWEPDEPQQFLDALRWAREQGAQIISCSVIMPSWSDGEGGGEIHEAVAALLSSAEKRGRALFFACAGNTALRHWSGRFRPGNNAFHEWQTGEIDNELAPWGAEPVSVELFGKAGAHYELIVQERSPDGRVEARQDRTGPADPSAMVRICPKEGHTYQVRVRSLADANRVFHVVALGGDLQHANRSASIPFPADGPEVIAVGAVDSDGQRMAYSSCGPNSAEPKPDFVAAVPFVSRCRSRPFSGTSAAAPQAAAAAALIWSRYPKWSANQVRAALQSSAADLGPTGHDYETGYGLVRLPELSQASIKRSGR
jgi:hypothetical protein